MKGFRAEGVGEREEEGRGGVFVTGGGLRAEDARAGFEAVGGGGGREKAPSVASGATSARYIRH